MGVEVLPIGLYKRNSDGSLWQVEGLGRDTENGQLRVLHHLQKDVIKDWYLTPLTLVLERFTFAE